MVPLTLNPAPSSQVPTTRKRQAAWWKPALVLAVLALAVFFLHGAWQQTRLREAYLPELESMARRSPNDGRLLALLGARLMEAGEMEAASETLRRAIVGGDSSDEVWLTLAAANAAQGQRKTALGDLALARHVNGDTSVLLAAQTRTARLGSAAETPAADAALTEALCPQGPEAVLSTHASGSFLSGVSEWWGRRHADTSGYATRQEWVTRQPGDAQAQRLWGLALERNRRFPEAREALNRAVALAPLSPAAHLALADLMYGFAPPARTGLEYITCLKLRPDWLPALLGLGRVGVAENVKYGVAAYQRATIVAPQSADAWIGLGKAYSLSNLDTKESVAAFATAARIAPDRTDFFGTYAEMLRQSNRWDEAETLLRQRLKTAPEDSYCHSTLGTILLDSRPTLDRQAEAEAQTREALRLTPHSTEACNQLAKILLGRFDAQAALPLLQQSLADDPYNINTLHLLGRTYQQTGQPAKSAEMTARAKACFSDQEQKNILSAKEHTDFTNPRLHEQLAALFARSGRPDRASQELEIARLLRSSPTRIAAQEKSLDADLAKLLPQ